MREIPINSWAVIVAALARILLGALWYSPALFLPRWMQFAGVSQQQMKSTFPKAMAADVVGSLVMSFVLVHAIVYAGANGLVQGAIVGFLNWLGFIAFVLASGNIYEQRPLGYYGINAGYQLIALLLMGAILGAWM